MYYSCFLIVLSTLMCFAQMCLVLFECFNERALFVSFHISFSCESFISISYNVHVHVHVHVHVSVVVVNCVLVLILCCVFCLRDCVRVCN